MAQFLMLAIGDEVGSEDLHKRKALKRQQNNRNQAPSWLILCEGMTEFHYFNGYRNEFKIRMLEVKNLNGDHPKTMVKKACEFLDENNEYDKVYCVFDHDRKDCETDLKEIKNKIAAQENKPILIVSVKCFEYWLLLHFEENTTPYEAKGKKSAGDQLKAFLKKKYLRDYQESDKEIFQKTKHGLADAIKRAKRINTQQKKSDTNNPSTQVYLLMEALNMEAKSSS